MKTIGEGRQRLMMRSQAKLELASFPAHAAPVAGALALALTLNPWNALMAWAVSWLALRFAVPRVRALHPLRSRLWWVAPVRAVNAWPARWLLVADGLVLALRHGAPVMPSLAIAAGWLAVDAWQSRKRGRSDRR